MKHLHRILPKVVLLGSLSLSPVMAEDVEANSFIANHADGHLQPRNRSQEAYLLFKDGRFNEAATAFEKLLANDPSNGQAWFNLGLTQLKLKQFRQAILSFHTARNTGMEDKAHYHLAYALVMDGEVLGAMGHLKDLLKTQPQHDKAWTLLGRCYETYGRFAEAKECYQKALAIDPLQGEASFRLEKFSPDLEQRLPVLATDTSVPVGPADETSISVPNETLPLSRVLREDNKTTPAHEGFLPPLSSTYHLSADLPHGVKLTPTQEVNWSDLEKQQGSMVPTLAPAPPKMEVPLEEL